MAASKFSTGGYNLLENNCNNFSNDFATFLTGEGIPVSSEALSCVRSLPMAAGSQSNWQPSGLLSPKPAGPQCSV